MNRKDIPTKKEVKYYLYKPRGDYYFESKPDGLYLYVYDAHDVHTMFSHLFEGHYNAEPVGNQNKFPNVFRITRKAAVASSEKKAFNPNEATLEELADGIQFVPKFVGNTRSFILSRDGIFKRGPYGSETFRQIPIRHAKMELGLHDAPKPVQDAFDYFTGSFDALIKRLMETNEFHVKRIRSASMKKTAAAGPYTILLDLEQDIRRGYVQFDWDKWVFAMGHAKGADYVVGDAGGAIVTNLIRLHLENGITEMDKKRVWRILTGNIGMALRDNEIFKGLSAERSFDTWKDYMQSKRRSMASELLKVAKDIVADKRYKDIGEIMSDYGVSEYFQLGSGLVGVKDRISRMYYWFRWESGGYQLSGTTQTSQGATKMRASGVNRFTQLGEKVAYGYHKTYGGDPYWLTLKYPGHCDKCHKPLARGERAYYYPRTRTMFGEACGHGQEAEQDFHSQVEMEEGHLI